MPCVTQAYISGSAPGERAIISRGHGHGRTSAINTPSAPPGSGRPASPTRYTLMPRGAELKFPLKEGKDDMATAAAKTREAERERGGEVRRWRLYSGVMPTYTYPAGTSSNAKWDTATRVMSMAWPSRTRTDADGPRAHEPLSTMQGFQANHKSIAGTFERPAHARGQVVHQHGVGTLIRCRTG